MSTETSPGAVTPSKPLTLWFVAGGLALVSLAAAAAIALRPSATEMVPLNAAKPEASAPLTTSEAAHKSAKKTTAQAPRSSAAAEPKRVAKGTESAPAKPAKPALEPVRVAALCSYCGVIEAVEPVQKKGEGTGLGAVAGGVLGAVAGNQVGRGDGRKAMTVLGAVGGGLAGHEVEKRARSETVYQVRIRFDDGSVRTIEQATAPKVGARVELHGSTLKSAA
ncbi:MAG: glycine zipper 2TM domain-containing protein [Burkholderiaceae bacterium]